MIVVVVYYSMSECCGLLYHESVFVVMWRREKVTGCGGTGSELVLPYIVKLGKGS